MYKISNIFYQTFKQITRWVNHYKITWNFLLGRCQHTLPVTPPLPEYEPHQSRSARSLELQPPWLDPWSCKFSGHEHWISCPHEQWNPARVTTPPQEKPRIPWFLLGCIKSVTKFVASGWKRKITGDQISSILNPFIKISKCKFHFPKCTYKHIFIKPVLGNHYTDL